jgi:hypothetical protein
MNFWDFVVWVFWAYVFFAVLMIFFTIVSDIFRDRSLNGWLKAVWLIFLVFVPFISMLVYLIARGRSMTERRMQSMAEARQETDAYIRAVATPTSPAEEIAKAQALLDSGSISRAEFDGLKARALATPQAA